MIFVEKQGMIINSSLSFCELSRFDGEELVGEQLETVWNDLLRINVNSNFQEEIAEAFLFTKNFDVRFVNITKTRNIKTDEITYHFSEIPNAGLEIGNSYVRQLLAAEFTGIAVYSVPDMILLKANRKYLSFLQPPYNNAAKCTGRKVIEILPGWESSPAEQFWKEAINSGKPVQVKGCEYIGYEKGITYWDSVIIPVYEDGEIKYVISSTTEATEEVMSKKKLAEQRNFTNFKSRQLEAIIEGLSDLVSIVDKNGNYIKMSKFAAELNKDFTNVFDVFNSGVEFYDFDGNSIPQEEMCVLKALKSRMVHNQKLRAVKDGTERYINCSVIPVLNNEGEAEAGIILAYDISDFVLKERELEQQKEQVQTIIESMSDAVTIFDRNGKYILVNRSAREMFSLPQVLNVGDFFKQGVALFDDKGNMLSEEFRPEVRIQRGEKFKEHELCLLTSGGREIHFNISGTPVYDSHGDFLLGILVSRDITERKIQEQIITIQKEAMLNAEIKEKEILENSMKLKDEFLYLITHEFKTPLAVINSALQAMDLLCRQQMPAKADKFINIIKQNTNRQLRLVNNLLDIVRFNAGHIKLNKKNFDIVFLTQAIVNSVQIYANQKNIRIGFSSRLRKREIYIDEEKYERILLNLLSNALKFTPAGKSINVHLQTVKHKSRSMVAVNVQDEGIGIPKDKQEYIFERFGQADTSLSRQTEGAGIGLHLVKLLLESLDGCITLESEEGKGSTFTIMFPAVKGENNDEIPASTYMKHQFLQNESRLIQTANIEFSDIYL